MMNEKGPHMKMRITRIPPIRTGLIIAGVCAILLLLVAFVVTLADIFLDHSIHRTSGISVQEEIMMAGGYFITAYFAVVFFCLLYNMIARWTGGFEIVVEKK